MEHIAFIWEKVAVFPWDKALEWVKALAVPAVGVWVAYRFGSIQAAIGRQQADTARLSMVTAKNKLKLDLFDRRYAVYQAAYEMLGDCVQSSRITQPDEMKYLQGIQPAKWLFDANTTAYLETVLWRQMVEFQQAKDALDDAERGSDRAKLSARKTECRNRLMDQRDFLFELFKPYLHFDLDVVTAGEAARLRQRASLFSTVKAESA